MNEQEPEPLNSVVKSGKKQGLYSLLVKKKRVSCLQAKANTSPETVGRNPPQHVSTDNAVGNNDTVPSTSKPAETDVSTNVALCCAMTETSNKQMGGAGSKDQTGNVKSARKKLLHRTNGVKSEDTNKNITEEFGSIPKQGSVSDLVEHKKENNVNVKKTHRRSLSLSKNEIFIPGGIEKSMDSIPSGENSPESTSSPVAPHLSMRRRFLLSQRSVDNIMAQSPGSSPISTRSVPGNEPGKKKKTRPVSLVVLNRNSELHEKSRAPSMNSLAMNSLLAAQVLHLIPANKARERNFLHGRVAANSLLGTVELERVLPKREVRIYVATWNMNGQAPPQGLNPLLLPDGMEHVPDIVAVGTQESYPERFQWEVTLQETLGPSHVLFHSAAFGTLHLAIFLRRDLIWFCSVAEEASFSVRPGTAFRTKGALGVAFYLFGTSFVFITCHLTAHQDKVKERLQDIRRIVKSLELPKTLPTLRHRGKG